ncbi:Fatty acid-binding protein [Echinococcus granulosus]|uniref:Fatty acid-binding protein n=1 Tax=Echinococcus granulosus TaxID=6210 RepID=W6UDS5_ECHGR|nr:Fatty acid-binding protein [Echinococcus granulosus]EUB59505.1 Fatty acid-binding protein [Echinococcus granulosus]
MEAFLGTWKVDSNGDFHKFMHHFGVPTAIAKMVLLVGSKTIFSQKDADTYCIAVSSIKGKTEAAFRLDQEFEEACSGGATMKAKEGLLDNNSRVFFSIKSKITMEGGVMKHIQVGGGETIITTRTINGNIMTVVYTVGDLTCSRTYKRVQ